MTRVLALVPGGISNQILFFPTLDDLQRHYPQAEIDVIVEPKAKDAYRICPSVNQVLTFDFKNRNGLADWGNLLGKVRDQVYDVALSLEQHWLTEVMLWLSGIPTRVGYSGSPGAFLLTHPVPLREQYAAQAYHDLLQGVGITTPCPELTISVPKKDIEWAEGEQKRLGLPDAAAGDYVLIYGGQAGPNSGQYPLEHWQKIVHAFQQKQPDLPLAVIQSPEDRAWAAELLSTCPELKATAPADTGKLAAMIAGASLLVCTDSVSMHLAVAVQTYTLALFGPTDPVMVLPSSDRTIGLKSKTGRIADIPPDQILEQIWSA